MLIMFNKKKGELSKVYNVIWNYRMKTELLNLVNFWRVQHMAKKRDDPQLRCTPQIKQVLEPYSSFFLAVFGKSCCST